MNDVRQLHNDNAYHSCINSSRIMEFKFRLQIATLKDKVSGLLLYLKPRLNTGYTTYTPEVLLKRFFLHSVKISKM